MLCAENKNSDTMRVAQWVFMHVQGWFVLVSQHTKIETYTNFGDNLYKFAFILTYHLLNF